jgi:hypothetical protein
MLNDILDFTLGVEAIPTKKKRLKKVQGNTHQPDVYSSVLKVPTSKGSLKRIN